MTSLALRGTLDDQRGRVHAHLKKIRLVREFFLQVFLKYFMVFYVVYFCIHLDTTWPVCVHTAVLMVEALQLQLKVRSEHQRLMNLKD